MQHFKLLLISLSTMVGFCAPALASTQNTAKLLPLGTDSLAQDSLISLEQSAADRQREAERLLKEAEAIRRNNSNGGSIYTTPADRSLENRTNQEVDRLRNSFGNDRAVQESRERLERLRQERIRLDRNQPYYPSVIPGFIPPPYSSPPLYDPVPYSPPPTYSEDVPGSTIIQRSPDSFPSPPKVIPNRQFSPSDREFYPSRPDLGTASVSLGFANGTVNPAVGYRFGNLPISVEVGAVFNQDRLPPGTLNDFSVPTTLLQQFPNGFENLGRRTLTPQIGADLLGHVRVAPNVSLYGGVGVYFQGQATITRSNVTTDLFRQTSGTDINVAVSGGADVKISDSWRIGGGYHSIRGITAKIGIDFQL
jgi:Outer membrane protein beta-barrel domain